MYKRILAFAFFIACSAQVPAVDLTQLVCNKPEMNAAALTRECKGNSISANTICQGNEGMAWCKSANLVIGDTSILQVSIGFRNRHVPGHIWNIFKNKHDPIVLYDSSSTGYVTVWVDKSCKVTDKKIEFSNASAQVIQWLGERLGKRVEDSIPNTIPGC